MSSAVIIDSGCDLPEAYIQQNPIKIMPLNLIINGKEMADTLNERQRLDMIKNGLLDLEVQAGTAPTSVEQIREFYLKHVVIDCDLAIGVSIAKSRSPTFDNWLAAQSSILTDYRGARQKAGVQGHFSMRVINSGSMFTGQGLIAAQTIESVKNNSTKNQIRPMVEGFKNQVQAFAVPGSIAYLRERARQKGDKSVGFLAGLIGKALDIAPIMRAYQDDTSAVAKVKGYENAINKVLDSAIVAIKKGLTSQYICVSFAGELDKLNNFSRYSAFLNAAAEANLTVLTSVMNITGAINIGPGSFSLALATDKGALKF